MTPSGPADGLRLRDLLPGDWPAIRAIYLDGIATGLATFRTHVAGSKLDGRPRHAVPAPRPGASRVQDLPSLAAFLVLVACLLGLLARRALFATGPVTIAVQVLAALLMVWARATFGLRSLHAGATPTSGGIVTWGPYRYLRHPIYAAIVYFFVAAVASHPEPVNVALGALAMVGVAVRIASEERLLVRRYPEYATYAARTRRLLPFLF